MPRIAPRPIGTLTPGKQPTTVDSKPTRPTKPTKPALKFQEPTFELQVPDNLGRPPTSQDVQVRKGLDGRTPEEAIKVILGKHQGAIDPQNSSFVDRTLRETHKATTIAVNNAFIPGSPLGRLAAQHPGASVTVLGTVSATTPTIIKIEQAGKQPLYFKRGAGPNGFEQLEKNPYQVAIEVALRMSPPGVRLSYPNWSVPALAGATTSVSEG